MPDASLSSPQASSASAADRRVFAELESDVRSYCRSFPALFESAKGSRVLASDGTEFVDFFSGAGALNYGHNNDFIKERLLEHLRSDEMVHGLDFFTRAKRQFLEAFRDRVLAPGSYAYKLQFCGPTGTNAVEAALKLARIVTGRSTVFAFTGGYHGMTLGSLAVTGDDFHRRGAGVPLTNTRFMPYPRGFMDGFDTIEYIERALSDPNSGFETPAAVIVETTQGEGGIYVGPDEWLRRLEALCEEHDVLLICDDIQVGCGRTGPFFSFERAGIRPDLVTLSKSLSGYGLPFSALLIHPDLDRWEPAQHNGTFRGNQLAFAAGRAALELRDEIDLEDAVHDKEEGVRTFLETEIQPMDDRIDTRGLGLIWGVDLSGMDVEEASQRVSRRCFEQGLLVENVGRGGSTLKILPPLTIDRDLLERGLSILKDAIADVIQ
jgi:diaminobutyrate-2-oxoglutarate transaminase